MWYFTRSKGFKTSIIILYLLYIHMLAVFIYMIGKCSSMSLEYGSPIRLIKFTFLVVSVEYLEFFVVGNALSLKFLRVKSSHLSYSILFGCYIYIYLKVLLSIIIDYLDVYRFVWVKPKINDVPVNIHTEMRSNYMRTPSKRNASRNYVMKKNQYLQSSSWNSMHFKFILIRRCKTTIYSHESLKIWILSTSCQLMEMSTGVKPQI